MLRALVVSIRLYEGRYHGAGEWPPAPARVFQALVAGAGLGGPLQIGDRQALEWLERLDAPVICAPRKLDGHSVTLYVPNNDLDKVGGDPRRVAEIRGDQKVIKPRLFDSAIPFTYAWEFEEDEEGARNASVICALAERLYQFGRGVDFACAWGEQMDRPELEEKLLSFPGTIHKPLRLGSGSTLKCPARGSLKSLDDRYRAYGRRFRVQKRGTVLTPVFTKPPSARFAKIAYDSPPWRYTFDLREHSADRPFAVWHLAHIVRLVELLRDGAAARLRSALPQQQAEIERVLAGRKPDGSNNGPTTDRIRIVPLPSIGHYHADRGIRRVLMEVPASCPLRRDDVEWAFSGLELPAPGIAGPSGLVVTRTTDDDAVAMLHHYGIGKEGHTRWHTVTPAALPESAARRRIDPQRMLEEAKAGKERVEEGARAGGAVVQALRHAEVRLRPEVIRVQREPFESNGERAETFAEGTRFSKHRLWHVEVVFLEGIVGPLVIGDGRFLGLGIMAPVPARSAEVTWHGSDSSASAWA
jgi:CRISPR-associated protein Csb2